MKASKSVIEDAVVKARKAVSDNISGFNGDREFEYIEKIMNVLSKCASAKIKFSRYTHLRKHVCSVTNIHRTSIDRNAKYSGLLSAFIAAQPGAASFVEDNLDIGVVEAKLRSARAEVGNLRREVKRLNNLIARSAVQTGPVEVLPRGAVGQVAQMAEARSDADVALADAYMMLAHVIARAEIYSVDRDARSLYDETKASGSMDRVIAERVRAGRFIAWLEHNQTLAVVRAIPLGKERE